MTDEHKRRTLKMIAVMQAYVDGKQIEHTYTSQDGWVPLSEPSWNWGSISYRALSIPDSINWDHVSPEWKYMARDADNSVSLYKIPPVLSKNMWCSSDTQYAHGDGFSSYVRGTVDWKDSLVRRPS